MAVMGAVIGQSPDEVETALRQLYGSVFGPEWSQRPRPLPGRMRWRGRPTTPEPRAEVRRLPAAAS